MGHGRGRGGHGRPISGGGHSTMFQSFQNLVKPFIGMNLDIIIIWARRPSYSRVVNRCGYFSTPTCLLRGWYGCINTDACNTRICRRILHSVSVCDVRPASALVPHHHHVHHSNRQLVACSDRIVSGNTSAAAASDDQAPVALYVLHLATAIHLWPFLFSLSLQNSDVPSNDRVGGYTAAVPELVTQPVALPSYSEIGFYAYGRIGTWVHIPLTRITRSCVIVVMSYDL